MIGKKHRALLDYIDAYQRRNRCCPSFEEMMEGLGLKSKSGVHRLIKALEERGCIRRMPGLARAIEIIPQNDPIDWKSRAYVAESEVARLNRILEKMLVA